MAWVQEIEDLQPSTRAFRARPDQHGRLDLVVAEPPCFHDAADAAALLHDLPAVAPEAVFTLRMNPDTLLA